MGCFPSTHHAHEDSTLYAILAVAYAILAVAKGKKTVAAALYVTMAVVYLKLARRKMTGYTEK